MRLKKIEIENFKSFKDKQSLDFADRNLVVGKNGSGKSNLLYALHTLFLLSSEKFPQYNNSDEPAIVAVQIDNSEKRFLLPNIFEIKMVYKDSPQFFINDKLVSKEELKGLLENAGFSEECFIMQGKVNDVATMTAQQRFAMIAKVAGLEKYEESKKLALKYLNEDGEDKIVSLIEKIEMKMKISDEYKKKVEEYENLCNFKAEAEFELLNHELLDLNTEIDKLVVEEQSKTGEYNESLLEYEIKACSDEISSLKRSIIDAEEFIGKFDIQIVEQIKEKLKNFAKESMKSNIETLNENKSNNVKEGEDLSVKSNTNNSSKSYTSLEEIFDINPYNKKVEILSKAKEELIAKIDKNIEDEKAVFIHLKALKYFDAMGSQKEDVGDLENQLKIKRQEIANYDQKRLKDDIKSLVSDRKNLWVKEKKLKDDIEIFKNRQKELENKVLYLGKLSINIFESLKKDKRVLGSVYDLFDVPEEYLEAFESVCKSSLFWIVVENEDAATDLLKSIDERATFIALNRIKKQEKSKIKESGVSRLADQIKCDEKYKDLANLICKDFYVAKSQSDALEINKRYSVNTVTLEGDVFSKSGSITGGFESSNSILRELKQVKKRYLELTELLKKIQTEIAVLSEKIKYAELVTDDESRIVESLKGLEMYLTMKIDFLKNKKISLPEICDIESKHSYISAQIPQLKLDLESIEVQLNKSVEKKNKIDELISQIKRIDINKEQIEKLSQNEKSLIDSLYLKQANETLENMTKIQKKHLLIDKRSQIMLKLGISDFRAVFTKNTKDHLINTLKQVNKALKSYSGFSKNEIRDDQRKELKDRLDELKASKIKILDFINTLDQKKDDTFNTSFSMISENFLYFYEAFTGKLAKLVLKNESIEIYLDNKICDVFLLSGGQKTVIALSLIFAIQKNDKSPFYLFDEIDANLDKEHSLKLSTIIKELDSQYVITTFKPEMIESASRYFGVVNVNKKSLVSEISKESAMQSVLSVNTIE